MLKEHLLYVGLFQSVFAAFVLGTKRNITISDIILVFCLISIAARFFAKIYFNLGSVYDHSDFSVGIIPLTFGPFLYLYTKYLTRENPPFNRSDLLHFLPFTIFIILSLTFFRERHLIIGEDTFFEKDNYLWIRIVFGIACFTSVLLYTIFTYHQLFEYRKSVKANQSYPEQGITLLWLGFVSILFILLFMSYFILGLVNALTFSLKIDLVFISSIGLIVLAYAVSYFGIRQPSIWENIYLNTIKFDGNSQNNDTGYSNDKAKYSATDLEIIADQLKKYMESEKPYLNTDLTLTDLSDKLSIQKSHLTYLLNSYIGANFFTFVNNYRLREVLVELVNEKNAHLTILAIAFDCGFNSKSTFNGLFKQFTGLTPTEYRKKHQT